MGFFRELFCIHNFREVSLKRHVEIARELDADFPGLLTWYNTKHYADPFIKHSRIKICIHCEKIKDEVAHTSNQLVKAFLEYKENRRIDNEAAQLYHRVRDGR